MPSPFPGVDPFIEDQDFWPDFHQRFMTYWCDQLLELLPDNYDARLEERVHEVEVLDQEEDTARYPDIALSQAKPSRRRHKTPGGGTLLLEPIPMALPEYEEVRESYIRVTHRPDRTLVAILELLSPTNKTARGFAEYLRKRLELFAQDIHVVEVDLLVHGQRLPMRKLLPPADHYAIVSRSNRRPQADVFAWTLHDCIPSIAIPLRPPDPDVIVNLGAVFTMAYDRGHYRRALDYSRALELPLATPELRWAANLARKKKS